MADAAGIILAGGRSSRTGTPKAALEWHGSTLLRRIAGIVARFEACRVRRLDAGALLEDPVLAALDPHLDSVLNLNEPAEYEAARARPAPEVTVRVVGADPALVPAATLGEAAATSA
jgi:hypothetical protein